VNGLVNTRVGFVVLEDDGTETQRYGTVRALAWNQTDEHFIALVEPDDGTTFEYRDACTLAPATAPLPVATGASP
jgi:hypothetical protein